MDDPAPLHPPGHARGPRAAGILAPGRTSWRLSRADRFALIIDAAAYFAALKAAMVAARHSILLIGWDFDVRISLDPEQRDRAWPDRLGRLLNALVEHRRELHVRILKWDLGVLKSFGRGATPFVLLDWITSRRVHLRLDGAHPLASCHHHKIAVVDDALAFCGGIDITVGRWDTREHHDQDDRRDSPWGFAQQPWHDATVAVDGAAARALGELARERWATATGERLDPVVADRDLWPDQLAPLLHDVEVGIARTQPAHGEVQAAAHEIEALYLAAIRRAERAIYCESQYFASHRIAEALAERLREPQGPEVVIVNPLTAEGWLEEQAMGAARALLVERLRAADREDRFRLYHPVAAGGTPIYVHAKILIVDDVLLKVGSSNLNNRSMGVDTECDIALEATGPRTAELRETIGGVRNDLLAEHLGTTAEAVAAAEARAGGSLIGAIEALRRPQGRSLQHLQPAELNAVERGLAEARLFDPERPEPVRRALRRLARRLAF